MNPIKPVGGAATGVFLPIVIEFGAKGARISDQFPYKWSGFVGTVLGLVETGVAVAGQTKKIGWPKEDEDVAMMAAMGGASLATGASILILDELRKRAAYTFKTELPLKQMPTPQPLPQPPPPPEPQGLEEVITPPGVTPPEEEMVKEI